MREAAKSGDSPLGVFVLTILGHPSEGYFARRFGNYSRGQKTSKNRKF